MSAQYTEIEHRISTAIYPGTFDPITNGHIDIIERSLDLFDRVVVAVAVNSQKTPLFSLEERKKSIEQCFPNNRNIEVITLSSGLLVDFAVEQKAQAIIRGIRAVSDFDYEFQLALMNRKLSQSKVDSVFLMPSFRWIYISSSIVKAAASNGGDISDLVPRHVVSMLQEKYQN